MKEHFLTLLRKKETDTASFRKAADSLTALIAQEAVAAITLQKETIHTPLAPTQGALLKEHILLIPVLRAGLVFLPPFLSLFPSASVGFIGIRRDEKTAAPHLYYENLPKIGAKDHIFLLEPMLATGGTSALSLQKLIQKGATPAHISLVTLLAAKPGIEKIKKEFPQVHIHTAAIDPELNLQKFIVPGLGDFGDRYFGTYTARD